MPSISNVRARWILDSRGFPTVYCEVVVDSNGKKSLGSASVPSGARTGSYEALELRDEGTEFLGKGVNKAVENINVIIAEKLANQEFATAAEVDAFVLSLDQSINKSGLGANAILGVSMACHRAFAGLFGLELWQYIRRLYFSSLPATPKFPRLMCNVINGGAHADSGIDIQEFMVVPNTREIESDIRLASEVYHTLKKNLKKDNFSIALGDEGGFAPKLNSTKEALDYLQKAIVAAGYNNLDCELAMDCASNEFYNSEDGTYKLDGKVLSKAELVEFYKGLKQNYNIVSIEDGCQEDDVEAWKLLTSELGSKMHLIGDDLFVTNPVRFAEIGLTNEIANGVLIKLNQIGSVLETCQMINKAKENGYVTAVSHRSGETTDDFISDLAFASQSEFIKLGAPARGERVAKFNRLLEIKDSLS
jgi:enolase